MKFIVVATVILEKRYWVFDDCDYATRREDAYIFDTKNKKDMKNIEPYLSELKESNVKVKIIN